MCKPSGALKVIKNGKMVNPLGSLTDGLIGKSAIYPLWGAKMGKMIKPVGSLADGLIGGTNLQVR